MSIQPASPAHNRRYNRHNFREKAQKALHPPCKVLAAFLGRSTETADIEDLRRVRLHLIVSSLSASSANTAMQALRFFFSTTLDKRICGRAGGLPTDVSPSDHDRCSLYRADNCTNSESPISLAKALEPAYDKCPPSL